MRTLAPRTASTSSASTSSRRRSRPIVGSIADRGARAALHARASTPCCTRRRCTSRTSPRTARQDFVDTNITGTLNLLEEAVAAGVRAFVFTSTTSDVRPRAHAAGRARPRRGSPRTSRRCRRTSTASPRSRPRTCASWSTATTGLPCLVLRTSRFFPEADDDATTSAPRTPTPTSRSNELLYRRVDIEDVVERAPARARARARARLRPLHHQRDHAVRAARTSRELRRGRAGGGAPARARRTRRCTRAAAGGCSPPIDRVYVNERARDAARLAAAATTSPPPSSASRRATDPRSALARAVGAKGYHAESFGPYTTR